MSLCFSFMCCKMKATFSKGKFKPLMGKVEEKGDSDLIGVTSSTETLCLKKLYADLYKCIRFSKF